MYAARILAAFAAVATAAPAVVPDVDSRGLDIDLGVAARGLDIDLGVAARRSSKGTDDKELVPGLGGVADDVTAAVNEILANLCESIGGTQLTKTVCETASGSDISVGVADPETGLAKVTISGRGLLDGASITVPVGSLESVLGRLV